MQQVRPSRPHLAASDAIDPLAVSSKDPDILSKLHASHVEIAQ
jgi:hypothetical protein